MSSTSFHDRLKSTKSYCARHFDLSDVRNSLRCAALAPTSGFFDEEYESQNGSSFNIWYNRQLIRNTLVVDNVVRSRSAQPPFKSLSAQAVESFSDYSGQLMLYSPFYSGGDGLAEGESDGFFDQEDSPPWATYVAYVCICRQASGKLSNEVRESCEHVSDGVLCWIPGAAIKYADEGLKCIPAASLVWVADLPDDVKEVLGRWFLTPTDS